MDQIKLSIGITGSHGFIGSHLAKALKKSSEYEVVLFDRNQHDLMDRESLKDFVSGRNVIFHIAGANRDSNESLIRVNVSGTLNLLEAIKKYGEKNVKFIYASSIQVYNPSFVNSAFKEEDPVPLPCIVFGISKITAEKLIHCCEIDSIIFRISNVYGPLCRPFYNSVVATFCYLATKNQPIQINGDGEQKRDFIFISDVVDGLIRAINFKPGRKDIFNMGSGELTSLNQIIKILEKNKGEPVKIEYQSQSEGQKEMGWVLTDQEKIHKKLRWFPNKNFEEGIKETYLSFQNSQKIQADITGGT